MRGEYLRSGLSELNTIHKCASCHKFSRSDSSIDATCEHCGAYLDLIEVQSRQKFEEEKRIAGARNEHPVFWLNVKPGDNRFRAIWVRFTQSAQLLYMAIISFLLWIVAVIAG